MKISEYLIKSIEDTGTRHVFGIQGDYILNFYNQLCESNLRVVNTCTEQGAGFAADAYARITGFGVVCVTYGVGGLSLANSTAQAFAERSPVLVISGAPGVSERQHNPLLHHKISSFQAQLNIFREMTVAQAVLEDSNTAGSEINRVINAIKETKRPGYIELPRDMVNEETYELVLPLKEPLPIDQNIIDQACHKALDMIAKAKRPIIIAGVEVHRFGLQELLLRFITRSGLPFVTGVLGKSVIAENHPQFIGVYAGAMSPENVRSAVEDSDCVIAIGPLITDLATGMFSYHINPNQAIVSSPDSLFVGSQSYPGISMGKFLELITLLPQPKLTSQSLNNYEIPSFVPEPDKAVSVERLIVCVNSFITDDTVVIADVGDTLFAGLDLRVHGKTEFFSPAYYASLGFAIPAASGVQFAMPKKRVVILVGDGSFQMSAAELSVAARYQLNPVVIVFNNGGYSTFRSMIDGEFNDVQPWRYAEIVKVIGAGEGYTVSKEEELSAALLAAKNNNSSPTIIDVRLEKNDCSERLRKLTDKLKKRV
ncbi:MAG: thiamine pyrophosphate-binding protein [Candidatus Omnitrophica bacterium]|nr:thiamine pyrophosphate-binding protein [Candidatus Omnitrophota bacterium]